MSAMTTDAPSSVKACAIEAILLTAEIMEDNKSSS
jgi:hypothetical protein